jgi:hypothetical protein
MPEHRLSTTEKVTIQAGFNTALLFGLPGLKYDEPLTGRRLLLLPVYLS